MFLKRFKEKSIQKHINNYLDNRKASVHSGLILSVGIVLNLDEFNDYDKLREIIKSIGVKDNRVKFIAFIDDEKSAPNSWDSFFNPKEIGWKGKILGLELEEFINTKFDALICYYRDDKMELNFVSALSKANFKIGISNNDPRLYDFIIDIETEHIQVFEKELTKYLKVLNKI